MNAKLSQYDKYKKSKKSACFTISDLYDIYPNRNLISRKQFLKALTTFNDILIQSSIDTGKVYQLPHYAGALGARKKTTPLSRVINFRASRDAGKYVAHNNYHSNGFLAKLIWDKSKPFYNFGDRDVLNILEFEPTRPHKRLMAKAIKEKNSIINYYDI